jgi:hypothetical protein
MQSQVVRVRIRVSALRAIAGLVIASLALAGCDGSEPVGPSTDVTICSFNVKWLGHYTKRDDASLCSLLKDYDIVVIQELVAPPYSLTYPDGTPAQGDKESKEFFEEMKTHGFEYWLSEEDTGPADTIHSNSTSTEWWVAFYKPEVVQIASDLPWGFLALDRSNNADYERVPYAFSFRAVEGTVDFVLVSVHLQPGTSSAGVQRRADEIRSIATWAASRPSSERDFIVLGDMNIEDCAELASFVPAPFVSLNAGCNATNTSPTAPRPYDHVLIDPDHTKEVDAAYGFRVVSLVDAMRTEWSLPGPYPGDPYDSNLFPQYYSDHNPVSFRLRIPSADDD